VEEKKKFILAVSVLLFTIVGGFLFLTWQEKKTLFSLKEVPTTLPTPVYTTPDQRSPGLNLEELGSPTLTPETKAIISKIENHVVIIENKSFSPQNLTVNRYDQVEWENQDEETYQIKGENWGDVLIIPEESFTQAFNERGTYPYTCTLHPNLKGTIIVE